MERNRRGGFGVLLLFNTVMHYANDGGIPPVTLAVVALQTLAYLRLIPLPWTGPRQACISLVNVWYKKEWHRLLYAAFEHGDDMHLYYNMASFLWKGRSLERRFGSAKFFYILSVFTILTSATYVLLYYLLEQFFSDAFWDHKYNCAVGFSGVIFALKVLTTYYWPYEQSLLGFGSVSAKFAVWLELVLIQMLTPNASFIGHLAGILVGLAYTTGPLKLITDILPGNLGNTQNFARRFRFTRRLDERTPHSTQRPPNFPYYVPPGMSEEEQIRLATEESLRDHYNDAYYRQRRDSSSSGDETGNNRLYPNLNELRRARLQRYS